ncbi:MAG: TorF family putative porin [Balneolaceae bacterium]
MKTLNKITSVLLLAVVLLFTSSNLTNAQEVEVSTGVDLYSTYVFRGVAFSGPSWQPSFEVSAGSFTIGAWGSQDFANTFQEMDLYLGYSFDFGLYLGLTDYYYPGSLFGDGESHAIEINVGYEIDNFSLAANYIPEEALNAGSIGDDMYFEAGYSVDDATSIFLGAGNGWHTNFTDDFGVVNIGATTGKELVISDTFTIPVSGSVIYNAYSEQFFILVGFSF